MVAACDYGRRANWVAGRDPIFPSPDCDLVTPRSGEFCWPVGSLRATEIVLLSVTALR
jgi:hypothetical protein